MDIGNITATYQPGHSHADTFNYELRIDGKPFIVDTGISTYEKNERRQYERSTPAHNTVTINGSNSSDVWSGFRVGKRAKIIQLQETENSISAVHNGFGKKHIHKRDIIVNNGMITINDTIPTADKGISYIHFSPQTDIVEASKDRIHTNNGTIGINGAAAVEIVNDFASTQYNKLQPIKVARIHFSGNLQYNILYANTLSNG